MAKRAGLGSGRESTEYFMLSGHATRLGLTETLFFFLRTDDVFCVELLIGKHTSKTLSRRLLLQSSICGFLKHVVTRLGFLKHVYRLGFLEHVYRLGFLEL